MSHPRHPQGRQRRHFSVTGLLTTAALGYGAYRLVQWAMQDDEGSTYNGASTTRTTSNPQNARERRQRMTRCRNEVRQALQGFLPAVRQVVEQETSVADERQQLKELRASEDRSVQRERERELWRTVTIQSVARLVGTAYAHTLLWLVLTVQVHLLGAHLWQSLQTFSDSVSSTRTHYDATHRAVLQHTFANFLETGLHALVRLVQRVVEEELHEWDVLDDQYLQMDATRWRHGVNKVRRRISVARQRQQSNGDQQQQPSLLSFILPPSARYVTDTANLPPDASQLLDETWDLLESPLFCNALEEGLEASFRHLLGDEDALPLAQRVTGVQKTVVAQFYAPPHSLDNRSSPTTPQVQILESLPDTLELADVSFS